MTEYLDLEGGRIAYDVTGSGPLVVLSHGITVAMVEGAGHYPHAQSPDQVAALVIGFLKEHAGA